MGKENGRKAQLLGVALAIAEKRGYTKVTREAIASDAKVSPALVTFYFGTTANMKRDIMRAAIAIGSIKIVAQGLADGNTHARKAPEDLRKKAAASLAG